MSYERGDSVQVRAYSGKLITRRVWKDRGGPVVNLTTEAEYQRATRDNDDAEAPGWRRSDIVTPSPRQGHMSGEGPE